MTDQPEKKILSTDKAREKNDCGPPPPFNRKILPEQIIGWQNIYDHRGKVLAVTEESKKMLAEMYNSLYRGVGSGKPAKIPPDRPKYLSYLIALLALLIIARIVWILC